MNFITVFSRFGVPRHLISLYYFIKYRCIVSPRAEVELTNNLCIGRGSQIGSFTKIKATAGRVVIGKRVDIATGCFLGGMPGGLVIGDDCLIGPNCTLLSGNYNYTRIDQTIREQGHSSKGTRIGDNVWIGSGSVIADGSDIAHGSVIAPNSVVLGKIPGNSIVQGNPAKVIFIRR
nr:acyltransferase [Gammaproteobacteria bacterium]